MPRLTGTGGPAGHAADTRLAVTFRLLLLLRGLLAAMALALMPGPRIDPALLAAVALLGVETALAAALWRRVLPVLLRHPALVCLDAVLVFAVVVQGGVFGPVFLFTVMTSALAGVLYAWGPVLAVCMVQIALCYLAMPGTVPSGHEGPGLLMGLPVFYPFAACAGVVLRRLFDQYAEAEEARRTAESALAAAEERARLAREMHDSLAKTLEGVALSASVLPVRIRNAPERAERDAAAIIAALAAARREARGLIADLREEAFLLPLGEGVRRLCAQWSASDGVPVELRIPDCGHEARPEPPPLVRYEIIAVLKEALVNVGRHAGARSVEVTLRPFPNGVELVVRDDGKGFEPPDGGRFDLLSRAGHYGLLGMAERARRVGGRFRVDSSPGGGAAVRMAVPYARPLPGSESDAEAAR
ncbi:sensor histidine kinase [Actinomadura hibisca]|uniref:sensor histidine kinase n=1 Tax=Actinomadura hibisca TaxID=68565 RepID=UPI00083290E6|nr:sensor histidine kinase [Actinomadura hibisca]